jgi:hypothetical protein
MTAGHALRRIACFRIIVSDDDDLLMRRVSVVSSTALSWRAGTIREKE